MPSYKGKYFLQNLKFLMKLQGYNNTNLAQELGIAKSAISNYLSGTYPNGDIMEKMCEVFGYTYTEFMDTNIEERFLRTKVNRTTLKEEDATGDFRGTSIFDELALFKKKVCCKNDNIYLPQNFDDWFYFTSPIFERERCYAVRVYGDDSINSAKIFQDSVAIFVRDLPVCNHEIGAVYLKKENQIVIRRIHYQDEQILLSSDLGETVCQGESIKNIIILGKVVRVFSSL